MAGEQVTGVDGGWFGDRPPRVSRRPVGPQNWPGGRVRMPPTPLPTPEHAISGVYPHETPASGAFRV